jgi:hypothetical protein
MNMSTLPRPGAVASSAIIQWLIGLATRLLARSLNMPEPLVYSTGVLVVAHVQAIETRAARTLCPIRLLRQLRSLLR